MTEPLSTVLARVDQEMKQMTDSIGMARPKATLITEILAERGKSHGEYDDTAVLAQRLKEVIYDGHFCAKLTPVQCESLDMICSKIARILSGDNNLKDHWDDIAGYAKLAAERV